MPSQCHPTTLPKTTQTLSPRATTIPTWNQLLYFSYTSWPFSTRLAGHIPPVRLTLSSRFTCCTLLVIILRFQKKHASGTQHMSTSNPRTTRSGRWGTSKDRRRHDCLLSFLVCLQEIKLASSSSGMDNLDAIDAILVYYFPQNIEWNWVCSGCGPIQVQA